MQKAIEIRNTLASGRTNTESSQLIITILPMPPLDQNREYHPSSSDYRGSLLPAKKNCEKKEMNSNVKNRLQEFVCSVEFSSTFESFESSSLCSRSMSECR